MDDHVSNNLVDLLNTLKSPNHNNCYAYCSQYSDADNYTRSFLYFTGELQI